MEATCSAESCCSVGWDSSCDVEDKDVVYTALGQQSIASLLTSTTGQPRGHQGHVHFAATVDNLKDAHQSASFASYGTTVKLQKLLECVSSCVSAVEWLY